MDGSDRNLIEHHIAGRDGAFEAIVRRYGPAVLGYLTKMTHNSHKADDLFQETFRKVYQKAHTFKGDNLKPWIFRIAANTALSDMRKTKRKKMLSLDQVSGCPDGQNCPALEIADPHSDTRPDGQAVLNERKDQVRKALMDLPEGQRSALILSYYHKLSYREIADSMDCTIGTVKTSIFRALKKLEKALPELSGGI